MSDDETLIYQLKDDIKTLFSTKQGYENMLVKKSFSGNYKIQYPMIVIQELTNTDDNRYFDGKEHIVNVSYQFTIYAEQTADIDAETNVRYIQNIIKDYMRGERYNSLRRVGPTPIASLTDDGNVKIGYMRYSGCINIDTNTIYRRN